MTTKRFLPILLLAAASLVATGCLEGRPAPTETAMVSITSGLTFTFGDEDLCQSATDADRNEVDCEDVRNAGEGETFQIAKAYPTATVVLKPFAIDVHEVTNAQYEYCVEQGKCSELKAFNAVNITDYYRNPTYDQYPVVNATWEQAKAYCEAQGKRLPTQFEWERAAGGATVAQDGTQDPSLKRRYPWTQDPATVQSCVGQGIALTYCGSDRNPVSVKGASFDQVTEGGTTLYGFAGNVSEWVMDFRVEDITCRADLSCPDCWNCTNETCFNECYQCDECWDADPPESCYALCKGTVDTGGLRGYPVCFRYEEPLFCAPNASGDSECCLGNFADQGGADCFSPVSTQGLRAFRGGSYATTGAQTCAVRSGDRSQGFGDDQPQQRVGFRCAQSL